MAILNKDETLIALLRENARISVAEIARRLDVSRTAAQVRLEKLHRTGVIAGYTVRLSTSHLHSRVRAMVMIKSPPANRASVEMALGKIPALTSLHSISGAYDLAAEVSAPTVADLDGIIDAIGTLDGVTDTQSSIILSTKIER